MQENPGDKKTGKENDSPKPNAALLNILANSLNYSLKYQSDKANATTRKCSSCGAARPADTDLEICDFCGNHFT